jgi:hypothetical protein
MIENVLKFCTQKSAFNSRSKMINNDILGFFNDHFYIASSVKIGGLYMKKLFQ